jgi:hypothetical protein
VAGLRNVLAEVAAVLGTHEGVVGPVEDKSRDADAREDVADVQLVEHAPNPNDRPGTRVEALASSPTLLGATTSRSTPRPQPVLITWSTSSSSADALPHS